MKSYRTFLLSSTLLSLVLSLKSQKSLIDSVIHSGSLRHIVEVLAADSMEGRLTGSTGNQKAALYISDQFESAGIFPVAVWYVLLNTSISDFTDSNMPVTGKSSS